MNDEKPLHPDDDGSAAEHDPFETFDRAQGIGEVEDPYKRYGEGPSRCPVQRVDGTVMTGPQVKVVFDEDNPVFAVIDHPTVSTVLRDGKTFSSTCYEKSMGVVMGHTILEMDEPEHSRYRGLIQKAFSKKALAKWEHELVRPIVDGCIDRFVDRGSADLVRELTFPFPVHVISGMLGLPEEDLADFHASAIELISIAIDPARGIAASQRLAAYFAPIIAARRLAPQDDLISVLATAELDGHRLDDDQICAFLRLLLPAGAETTYRSSSNLLFGLLSNPDQLGAVRDDHALFESAIEEGLRWEPPLVGILRQATRDTEIAGVPIPSGAMISVGLGVANRDPNRYDDAARFDISRKPRQHMAFGFGAHRCLGMHLARMETEVVLERVLDRLPNLHLDPDAEEIRITGMTFRSPTHLPVKFGDVR